MKSKRLKHELDIDTAKRGSSWGSVFAAAASVKLEEIDDDFLQRTQSTSTPLAGIAKLAKKNNSSSRKRARQVEEQDEPKKAAKESDESADDDQKESSSAPLLEGQMVAHPHKPDEQVMILVEKKNGVVFDALRQGDDGSRLKIGTLDPKGGIVWETNAFDDESGTFPFPTDSDDHCESPLDAYQDILPLLEKLFPKKKKCKIYDPYYCDGAVKRNLESLGFPRVYNEKEDCYKVWSSSTCPPFDALITNPPYSEDHIPKLVEFLSSPVMANKPWFLLMPQWVSKKPYFVDQWDKKALFLVPKNKRYVYLPPKDFREKKASDVHKKSSPFVSIWFVWGGSQENTNMLHDYYRNLKDGSCLLARSKNGLRDLRRKRRKK